jgi:hypothetical protein
MGTFFRRLFGIWGIVIGVVFLIVFEMVPSGRSGDAICLLGQQGNVFSALLEVSWFTITFVAFILMVFNVRTGVAQLVSIAFMVTTFIYQLAFFRFTRQPSYDLHEFLIGMLFLASWFFIPLIDGAIQSKRGR